MKVPIIESLLAEEVMELAKGSMLVVLQVGILLGGSSSCEMVVCMSVCLSVCVCVCACCISVSQPASFGCFCLV